MGGGTAMMARLGPQIAVSLKIAAMATVIVIVLGTPIARRLARSEAASHRLLDIVVHLPLGLPPTVIGYFLLVLLGRDGPIGKLIVALGGRGVIFTPTAAVIASSIVALPLFVQGARGALEAISPEVYEAAQVDGASRRQMFLHISLPLAWHGFLSGMLLAFVRSLGEFGATIMVAGNIPGRTQTMALAIYTAVQAGHDDAARTLALILTALAGVAMAIGLRWRNKYRNGGETWPAAK